MSQVVIWPKSALYDACKAKVQVDTKKCVISTNTLTTEAKALVQAHKVLTKQHKQMQERVNRNNP